MRRDINTYIESILTDSESAQACVAEGSVAGYIIRSSETTSQWQEFFDSSELEENLGEPTDEQIEELKEFLNTNWGESLECPCWYTLDGQKVFLALNGCEMPEDIKPFDEGNGNISAYKIEDWWRFIDYNDAWHGDFSHRCTYYESYGGRYTTNGDPIVKADVVNAENPQSVLYNEFIREDELDEVNEELVENGFQAN